MRKPTVLVSTATWLHAVADEVMTPERREELWNIQRNLNLELVRKYVDREGKRRVVWGLGLICVALDSYLFLEAGTKALKTSQVYPWKFCMKVGLIPFHY